MFNRFNVNGCTDTLVSLFERVFAQEPDAPALIFLHDGDSVGATLSRAQLRNSVLSLASRLQHDGGFGQRALLLFPTGPEFVQAYLACLYAGVVPVPCYPPSRTRADSRIAAIALAAQARFVLTTSDVGAQVAREGGWYPALDDARWILTDDLAPVPSSQWSFPAIDKNSLALMQFTSGSTADPRGVLVTHGNLLANLRDMGSRLNHDRHSVMVSWLPLFHDLGLIYGLLHPLVEGHLCVLMPPAAFLQKPLRWLQAISDYRATHAAAPNFAYDLCAARVPTEAVASLNLSSWRVALNAAEPVRDDTLRRFAERFAGAGFRPAAFCPGFGLAEATLHVTTVPVGEAPARVFVDAEALKDQRIVLLPEGSRASALVSSGRTVAPTQLRVVDPVSGQLSEPGHVGELWVAGPTVAQGYYCNEEATQATFGARLAGDENLYLRTGDLGFLQGDEVFVTGRLKDMVILHGLNYYPQDFESTVESCHPALAASGSAAFSVQGLHGEVLAVVAELERSKRKQFMPRDIISAIRQAISQVHGVSVAHVTLIEPHMLPRTTSGKVQRRGCRERLLAGDLASVGEWRSAQRAEPAAPVQTDQTDQADQVDQWAKTDLLAWLRQHFARQLGVAPALIDPDASVAGFGLDSVVAVGLSGELSQWLGRPIEPTVVYDHPSLRALAEHLAPAGAADRAAKETAAAAPAAGPNEVGQAVAIVGMACRLPGADSPDAFWQLLREGRCAVGEVPPERWDCDAVADHDPVVRYGGFLPNVDRFDAAFFGIAPREAERIDPQQRILLELAWEALERASVPPQSLAGSRTGVFIGVSNSDYMRLLLSHGLANELYLGTGNALSVCANRISYALDLKGPSLAVDTACSSSLVGIALACQSLQRGESDLALAGGVNLILSPDISLGFSAAGMLAPDGLCKAFSADADGYVRSEGAGLLVLKRLADAQRDGDEILALIRGCAVAQDGRSAGLTAPNGPAQQAVVRAALHDAGVPASAIGYVEAHGTGTTLGDLIEVNALAQVLGPGRAPDAAPCLIGSAKSNLGHLESAAGVAGVIKAVLALRHGLIPVTLHCEEVSPRLGLGHTLKVANRPQPWPAGATPRLAGVSSFGFGGTNAHLILQEAPAAAPVPPVTDARPHVLTLSARDAGALRAMALAAAEVLNGADAATVLAACHESQTARSPMTERLGLLVSQPAATASALVAWAHGHEPAPGCLIAQGRAYPGEAPRIAFLFTGQGTQTPAMGRDLYAREPVFRAAIAACDEVLDGALGASLASLLYGQKPAALDDMRTTQPAIFAVQYALARLWSSWGVTPHAVLGHSLGEFAAACVAGALDLKQALRLVVARGLHLQSISTEGVMVATTASEAVLSETLARWPGALALAAANGPGNLVFAGVRAAAEAAMAALSAQGAKCTLLAIAQASHSPLVDPVLEAFAAEARAIATPMAPRVPGLPMVSNVSGDWLQIAPDASYWCAHLRSPVRFAMGLDRLVAAGYREFIEIGAHPALITLGASQHGGPDFGWHPSLHRQRDGLDQMLASAAALWANGAPVDWSARQVPGGRARKVLPTYPFQRERHWFTPRGGTAVLANAQLPGERLSLALPGSPTVFSARLAGVPRGASHRVRGDDFLSAPAALCAFVAAALQEPTLADAQVLALDQLEWRAPLALGGRQVLQTQLVCAPLGQDEGQGFRLRLHSRDAQPASNAPSEARLWRHHVQVQISGGGRREPSSGRFAPTAVVDGTAVEPAAFYAALHQRGLEFSGHHMLQRIEVAPGRSRVWAGPPARVDSPLLRLCELAVQAAAAALGSHGELKMLSAIAHAQLPVRLEPTGLQALAQCQADSRVNVDVFDERGQRVAWLEGLSFVPVAAAAPMRYAIDWRPATVVPLQALPAPVWMVLEGPEGGGEVLARRLRGAAARAHVVRLAASGPRQADLDQAFAKLGDRPTGALGVICLAPGNGAAAIALAQALLRWSWPAKLWLVTSWATAAGSGQRLDGAVQAGAWGAGRSIALEHPALWGGLIDCDSADPEARAAIVTGVLQQWQPSEDQVAWRAGRAMVPRLRHLRSALAPLPALRAEATYLVTGGTGALGMALAAALVDGGARSVVLAARASTPAPAQQTAIDGLCARGAQVRYISLDVSQPAAVAAYIAALAAHSLPLRGIFHAAGVAGRCRVQDMTPQAFSEVYAAKAQGAIALAESTRALQLDCFVCIGSMVSAWGASEQAHYAAANAVADAVAEALTAAGRPAVSLALGPLAGGMLPASVAAAMATLGVASSSLADAAAAVLSLRQAAPAFQVLADIDWTRFAPVLEPGAPRAWLDLLRPAALSAAPAAGGLPAALAGAPPEQHLHLLRERVLALASSVLGVVPGAWGDTRRGFFDRGMDSITALELRRRLEREFAVTLPATTVFDHPSVEALAQALTLRFAVPESEPESESEPHKGAALDDPMASALDRLEQLVQGW